MNTKKKVKSLYPVLKEIGEKFSQLRKQKGYETIAGFAKFYKLPLIQYWRIENGKTNLTMRTLLLLLAIHQLSIDDFFC